MMREVKNLTGIKLTESDTEGIFLHFESGNLSTRISLDVQHGVIACSAIRAWAREQLDRQETIRKSSELRAERKARKEWERENGVGVEIGARPSLPVDGGH